MSLRLTGSWRLSWRSAPSTKRHSARSHGRGFLAEVLGWWLGDHILELGVGMWIRLTVNDTLVDVLDHALGDWNLLVPYGLVGRFGGSHGGCGLSLENMSNVGSV